MKRMKASMVAATAACLALRGVVPVEAGKPLRTLTFKSLKMIAGSCTQAGA